MILLEWGIITRPWYWIGWGVIRVVSLSKYPTNGPNDEELESTSVQVFAYIIGFSVPIIVVILMI